MKRAALLSLLVMLGCGTATSLTPPPAPMPVQNGARQPRIWTPPPEMEDEDYFCVPGRLGDPTPVRARCAKYGVLRTLIQHLTYASNAPAPIGEVNAPLR